MATIDEIRKTRIKKLEAIKRAGILPYPEITKRTHTITDALKGFNSISRSKKEVILVGRIKSQRGHGGSIFFDIEDGTGKIQGFLKKDRVGEKSYKFFLDNFDIGDFIEARGVLFKTKKGEKSLEVSGFKMLAKSLRPLPEKWHGLTDIEERFRKRYLDLIFNKAVREKFELRSKIIREIRAFMDKKGFLEVETPTLQPIYGGTKAKPFKTHLNAMKMDLYLRIAHELYLKRLIVGGFEKVYEIGRMFRNEGMDKSHNPEFTMLDSYWAYADYKDMMKLVEELFSHLLKKLFKKTEIVYEGKKINFKTPWKRMEFNQMIRKYVGINLDEINEKALSDKAKKLGLEIEKGAKKPEIADEIYKKICKPKIWEPTFVINHPQGFFPLAKTNENDGKKLASFQPIVAGYEMGTAFSELNDPVEQRKRFEDQEKQFEAGFKEAQRMDKDFIESLEYGMPPSAGFGLGIDRLTMLLTDSHSVREVILFPTMRPK